MNLKFTTFTQGHRLVVVIDGLQHIPTEQEQIQAYFQNLLGNVNMGKCVTTAPPADIKNPDTEVSNEVDITIIEAISKQASSITEDKFSSGPYTGKTPSAILTEGTAKDQRIAMQYLSKAILTNTLDKQMIKNATTALNQYLKNRFGGISDPYAYAEKLTENQAHTFLQQFENVIPEEIKTNVNDWNTLLKQGSIDIIREIISNSISYFQSLV